MEYRKTIRLKDGRDCVLRSGTAEDAQAALDNFILTHAQTDELISYPDEIRFTVEQEAAFLCARTESKDEIELLAVVDGQIAGLAGFQCVSRAEKMRHRASFGISIDRAYWGLGVGRALTQACIECARAAGYAQLELDVMADNERALALYKSEGFTEYGRNPRGCRSRYTGWQESVLMRLELVDGGKFGMKLVEPSMAWDEQIQAFRRDFLNSEGSMDGCGSLRRFDRTQDWLDQIEALKRPETTPPHWVPCSQYLYVREEDGKVVGVIQIRHYFNEFLEKYAGHIGYSVRPDERRKGYATAMLRAALPKCRALGLDRVLISCVTGNEGSRKTILNNGGVYESTVFEPKEGVYLERYWIDLRSEGER